MTRFQDFCIHRGGKCRSNQDLRCSQGILFKGVSTNPVLLVHVEAATRQFGIACRYAFVLSPQPTLANCPSFSEPSSVLVMARFNLVFGSNHDHRCAMRPGWAREAVCVCVCVCVFFFKNGHVA